jgi:DNA-binding NarL/FixJ family response regulator
LIPVLVVDDNEPFRRFVRATLSTKPELKIISEVSDGLEAVQKALELQPALIVLDIGLPGLNGLEAGRRIRKLSPKSTILFLSQESSPEIVQEALRLGALGFVIKAHAARDLLIAVEAVLRKEQFVSCAPKAVDR